MSDLIEEFTGTEIWDAEEGTLSASKPKPTINLEKVSFGSGTVFLVSDLSDHFISLDLDEYFSSQGVRQKILRKSLVSALLSSDDMQMRIAMVLNHVSRSRSQDVITAAVDLLTGLGDKIIPLAIQFAFGRKIENENVAFVLSSAAGRHQKRLIKEILLRSNHVSIREAAVELLSSLSPLEAKPALERIARCDESPALRERANELLMDLV